MAFYWKDNRLLTEEEYYNENQLEFAWALSFFRFIGLTVNLIIISVIHLVKGPADYSMTNLFLILIPVTLLLSWLFTRLLGKRLYGIIISITYAGWVIAGIVGIIIAIPNM